MKLDKIVLLGIFGMVIIFGLVLPQNVVAADIAGMQKLDAYLDYVAPGNKLDNEKLDDIEKIIRQDDKVDEYEYRFVYEVLHVDNYFDNKVLSSEQRRIVQAIYDDYAKYDVEVTAKYPELVDLGSKLPLELRKQIDALVVTNFMINWYLNGDEEEIDAAFKKTANIELEYVDDLLKELQGALPGSPYREFLTKLYNAEKLLLEENLKRLSER